jgi:membrane protease YdiL (CAAX protease family)
VTRGRQVVLALATAGVAAILWSVTAGLPIPARAWCVALLALLPAAMLLQSEHTGQVVASVSRRELYVSSALTLWGLGGVTLLVARASGMTAGMLGLRTGGLTALLVWTALTLAVGILILAAGRLAGVRESDVVRLVVPQRSEDNVQYALLCVSAGVWEEITYRAFLIPVLTPAFGSIWAAALVSAAAFGVLHSYQHAWGAARAGVYGFVLAVPFILSGSIVPSMIAHTAIDLLAGFWMRDFLLPRSPHADSPRNV